MTARYKEDLLLSSACKALGLRFWRNPKTWEAGVTTQDGKWCCDGYDENDDLVDGGCSSVEALGEIKRFSNYPCEPDVENIFFGVKTPEELSMRLDLLGCKKDVIVWIG